MTDPEEVEIRDCFRRELERLQKPKKAKRLRRDPIARLLEACAEQRTHSILDITRIANRKGFGAAVALPDSALTRFFGTLRPDRNQLIDMWQEIAEQLQPWHAVYLVVYGNGVPTELAFVGCSGD